MKRLTILLLACILLTACKAHGSPAAPVPDRTDPPETAEASTQTATMETGEEDPMETASESIRALLPDFPAESAYGNSVSCAGVTTEQLEDYVNQMQEQGFEVLREEKTVLLYRSDAILRLVYGMWEDRSLTVEAYAAAPDAQPIDLQELSWKLEAAPDDCLGAILTLTSDYDPSNASPSEPAELICALTVSSAEVRSQTGLDRCVCVRTSPEEGFEIREALVSERGAAWMLTYLGPTGLDPVCADLDGDGSVEYAFWGSGPTSGLFTVALWAYGVEEGLPVVRANTILNLSHGNVWLEEENGAVCFCCEKYVYDGKTGQDNLSQPVRLPLTIQNGAFQVKDGSLPEDIQLWGGTSFSLLGRSLSGVKDLACAEGAELLRETSLAVFWNEKGEDGSSFYHAAFSRDGVRVAGTMSRYIPAPGSEDSGSAQFRGFTPIEADPDLNALPGLTLEALEARFGAAHYDEGSGLYLLRWLTEDGKVLNVTCGATVMAASLFDPLTGTQTAASDSDLSRKYGPDDVFISMGSEPGSEGLERWERFTANAEAGRPDEVTLRLGYEEGVFAVQLRYDGERFRLTDEGRESNYACLLRCEETDPPAQALYQSAVHWILSDDPEMTYERCFNRLVSSTLDPSFPNTRLLFSLYQAKSSD
ncbi:MAG: hypothetical protein IJU06_03945 [Oscillospiraceae bacterium]|nr:hypothetical protein [Oscillospiraceae bacterium]